MVKGDSMESGTVSIDPGVGKLRTTLTMGEVLGHVVIWLLLSIITLGVGLFFWPYAAMRMILNSIEVYTETRGFRRCKCELGFSEQVGHIIIWLVISICTAGLAYPFYVFGVARTAINRTEVV